MSEFAANLPHMFVSFRPLGVESSSHKLPEIGKSENSPNVAETKEANTIGMGETSASPAINSPSLEVAPVIVECIGADLGSEDRNLTSAEKDCVLTSVDDDVEDLSASVAERLQCLNEGNVEKLIEDECVNVEEILCGNIGVEEESEEKRQSVCPNVAIGGDVDDRRFSPGMEINEILREELGGVNVISTPKRAYWPIYSKTRSSALKEPVVPVCKVLVFDVVSGIETVGGVELSKENVTDPSEGALRVS